MGDYLKKVQPGQRLRVPAAAYNAFIDTTVKLRESSMAGGRGAAASAARSSTIILVKNAAGADMPQFAVLGLGDAAILPSVNEDEFKTRVALNAVAPAAQHSAGNFCITQEPILSGEWGRAVVSGVSIVKVDVTDAGHTHADVTPADAAKLTSATAGPALILWKESGTGTKWAVVSLGSASARGSFLVKLTDIVSQGIYTGIEQRHGTGGWEDVPGADAIECQNVFEFDTTSSPLLVGEEYQPMVLVAVVDGLYLFDRPTNAQYRQEETP